MSGREPFHVVSDQIFELHSFTFGFKLSQHLTVKTACAQFFGTQIRINGSSHSDITIVAMNCC